MSSSPSIPCPHGGVRNLVRHRQDTPALFAGLDVSRPPRPFQSLHVRRVGACSRSVSSSKSRRQNLRCMNPWPRLCAYAMSHLRPAHRYHSSTRHTSLRSKNGTHRDPNPTSTYSVSDGSRNARTISARRLSMRNRLFGIVLTQSSSWTPLARTPVPGPTSMVATTSFVPGSTRKTPSSQWATHTEPCANVTYDSSL